MESIDVAIVGGGLAGTYAASELSRRNVRFQLFECKALLGGRIAGVPVNAEATQFFDIGPAWVFPHHKLTQGLAEHLNVALFPQFSSSEILYQFAAKQPVRRIDNQAPLSMLRAKGGTYAFIQAMLKTINESNVSTEYQVMSVEKADNGWQLRVINHGTEHTFHSKQVMFAIPPRILARDFAKEKWMTSGLLEKLNQCQTWMSAQAKVVITYASAFWREQGFSGQAFSQVGPLVEIYDASSSDNHHFALFGFVGLPAAHRVTLSADALKRATIEQVAYIFGEKALQFDKIYLKDWANDSSVCTKQDLVEGSRHPQLNLDKLKQDLINQGLYFVGSEFASNEAGYMEGALIAVNEALNNMNK